MERAQSLTNIDTLASLNQLNTGPKQIPTSAIESDVTSMTFTDYQNKLEKNLIAPLEQKRKSVPNTVSKNLAKFRANNHELKSTRS